MSLWKKCSKSLGSRKPCIYRYMHNENTGRFSYKELQNKKKQTNKQKWGISIHFHTYPLVVKFFPKNILFCVIVLYKFQDGRALRQYIYQQFSRPGRGTQKLPFGSWAEQLGEAEPQPSPSSISQGFQQRSWAFV